MVFDWRRVGLVDLQRRIIQSRIRVAALRGGFFALARMPFG